MERLFKPFHTFGGVQGAKKGFLSEETIKLQFFPQDRILFIVFFHVVNSILFSIGATLKSGLH